jgi:pimeloyl-ACP methyl ester carboxylesterase
MTPRRVLAALAALAAAGCGGGSHGPQPAATAPSARPAAAVPTPVPELTHPRKCPDAPGATCSTLRVPLDRSGRVKGSLDLRVAVTGRAGAPVVVFLTGGPGEPGEPFHNRGLANAGPLRNRVRVVTIDQRGTGPHALNCPDLQKEMGASDLTPPSQDAVTDCADRLGDERRFYTTTDTVADLEALRQALHAKDLALDGVSYGTYVAERYALAYPDKTRALVLDSVVPHDGLDLMWTTPMKATTRVLETACGKDCKTNPVADLSQVIEQRHDGPQLFDLITTLSIFHPHLQDAIDALHDAVNGNSGRLDGLMAGVHRVVAGYTAGQLSQGLHASTLCGDIRAPWGGADAPLDGRKAALDRAVAQLSAADLGPYDRETAAGNGVALQCMYWPPMAVKPPPKLGDLPDVPTLLIAGDNDLSTPLEWAQAEAKTAPNGHLMIVPGAGHSVQSQGFDNVLAAVRRTLRG